MPSGRKWMSDPFKTDYTDQPVTTAIVGMAKIESKANPALSSAAPTAHTTPSIRPPDFGFQPSIYGTGKPRRVIIRGKISVG